MNLSVPDKVKFLKTAVDANGEYNGSYPALINEMMTVLKKSDTFYFKPLIINGYLTAVNLFCSRNEAVEITGYV